MAIWIEVKIRYDRMAENGKTGKVNAPYLVDALTCTEAEARVIEEVAPFISGDYNVLSVNKTKIAEIFWDETGDRWYKVKANFITLDEKTGAEKRSASFFLVQASTFSQAFYGFQNGMKDTVADYEIESIVETKIMDVYKYKAPDEKPLTTLDPPAPYGDDKG